MFIEYKDIDDNYITIDVRTYTEYINMNLLQYNFPIINEKEYNFLHKYLILTIPIVLKGFIRNKIKFKNFLKEINNDNKKIVIGCSQGRVRSLIMYLYAKYLGYNAKILKYGIKPIFKKNSKNIKNLHGFLEI